MGTAVATRPKERPGQDEWCREDHALDASKLWNQYRGADREAEAVEAWIVAESVRDPVENHPPVEVTTRPGSANLKQRAWRTGTRAQSARCEAIDVRNKYDLLQSPDRGPRTRDIHVGEPGCERCDRAAIKQQDLDCRRRKGPRQRQDHKSRT